MGLSYGADEIIKHKYIVKFVTDAWATFKSMESHLFQNSRPCSVIQDGNLAFKMATVISRSQEPFKIQTS
jgi:ABC-type antimicrobial peptide transport system permease subunit